MTSAVLLEQCFCTRIEAVAGPNKLLKFSAVRLVELFVTRLVFAVLLTKKFFIFISSLHNAMMRHRAERIINSSCVKRSVIIGSVETPFPFFQEFLHKFSVSSSSEFQSLTF